tara:strand:- start:4023 stop:4676 length:654 start_codon:yes stop_codon:yes gene_type:complete
MILVYSLGFYILTQRKWIAMDLVSLGYSYSRIIHDYYVRNWKDDRGSSKTAIAGRAVSAYLEDTDIQKNVDAVFRSPTDSSDLEECSKAWAHQIDKFFSPYETVKLPYSFGDYLVMALDEEYRKSCLVALDLKRKSIIRQVAPHQGDILASVQMAIKETSEAIAHLVALAPNGLQDDSDQDLLRARQETMEAISSLQDGLSQLDYELSNRNIEIVEE